MNAADVRQGDIAGPADAELVRAARGGADWALEALFRRHAPRVNTLAHRLLGRTDADDLVQDAFITAFDRLDRLENPQAFSAWISSITVRTAHKRLRRRRLLQRLGLRRSEPIDLDGLVAPGAPADIKTEVRALYSIVVELPAEQRIALLLQRVEGLTIPEIAERMGLSAATIKRRISAAQRTLTARQSTRPFLRSVPSTEVGDE